MYLPSGAVVCQCGYRCAVHAPQSLVRPPGPIGGCGSYSGLRATINDWSAPRYPKERDQ